MAATCARAGSGFPPGFAPTLPRSSGACNRRPTSCSLCCVRILVLGSRLSGPHSPEGITPLTVVVQVAPGPFSGQRAPPRPRARARRSSAPRSRPSSRCPGGRRPLAPLLLLPRGASLLPAARGPGKGRGQPRTDPGSPLLPSHASRKIVLLHSAEPPREPCRDEVRAGGEGGLGRGRPRRNVPSWGKGAGVLVCTTRRGLPGRESRDHVLFVPRRRREVPGPGRPSVGWTGGQGLHGRPERPGRGLCENCRACKVQVAQGPLSVGSAPPQPRLLPVPHCSFTQHQLIPVPIS